MCHQHHLVEAGGVTGQRHTAGTLPHPASGPSLRHAGRYAWLRHIEFCVSEQRPYPVSLESSLSIGRVGVGRELRTKHVTRGLAQPWCGQAGRCLGLQSTGSCRHTDGTC